MTAQVEIWEDAIVNLVGTSLDNGWTITELLPRPGSEGAEDLTGAWFSVGYIAKKGNKKAFVKVIDIQRALTRHDHGTLMERLKNVTDSHSFECSILNVCSQAKLDRIVQILAKGEIPPPANAPMPIAFPYIMFEWAEGGDVRRLLSRSNAIEDAWRLEVLHSVAVGLKQLHGEEIAHQDLKPSNVLLFGQDGKDAKIGDLGCASRKGMEATHDGLSVAGALAYAPPEQIYGVRPEKWVDRREGCDLYHLGCLATFIFSGITPTDYYVQNIDPAIRPIAWRGRGGCSYQMVLPLLTSAFTAFVSEIRPSFPAWGAEELTQILINACNPDYTKRGDPDSRVRTGNPIGMETFISRFDRLSKRALVEIRRP